MEGQDVPLARRPRPVERLRHGDIRLQRRPEGRCTRSRRHRARVKRMGSDLHVGARGEPRRGLAGDRAACRQKPPRRRRPFAPRQDDSLGGRDRYALCDGMPDVFGALRRAHDDAQPWRRDNRPDHGEVPALVYAAVPHEMVRQGLGVAVRPALASRRGCPAASRGR